MPIASDSDKDFGMVRRQKLVLSKETVVSLHTRTSLRAGAADPLGGRSGVDKCFAPPGDDPPAPAPAPPFQAPDLTIAKPNTVILGD